MAYIVGGAAFNRTSMESKRSRKFFVRVFVVQLLLLIEPVWNRNVVLYTMRW